MECSNGVEKNVRLNMKIVLNTEKVFEKNELIHDKKALFIEFEI